MIDMMLDQFPDQFHRDSQATIGTIAAQTWGIQIDKDDVNTVLKKRYGGPSKEQNKLDRLIEEYHQDTGETKTKTSLKKRS